MTGKQILVELIRSSNQEVLAENGVNLRTEDLEFTTPVAGSFEGDTNTRVLATSLHPTVYGSYEYFYNRIDIQEAFNEIDEPQPSVHIDGRIDHATLFEALIKKYNFFIPLEDLIEFVVSPNSVFIKVNPTQLIWIGELTVLLGEADSILKDEFLNNVLNGFTSPFDPVLTDGGNYDQLSSGSNPLRVAVGEPDLNGFQPS